MTILEVEGTLSGLLANYSASSNPPKSLICLSIESFVYDEFVILILSRNLHMASSCQKLEVYVKAATVDPSKLGHCPFSQRVLMTCELKDIVYDVKYVDLGKKPDWFLKISPEGRVPLIKIGGKYIADSDVIVEVLGKEYPCPPLSTCPNITCRGQGLFPAGVAFFKSKDPKCDGSEAQFICELDHMNQHLCKDGPYIAGKYLTSADIALAPKLYVLQTALAYYKNWTNFEQFYPALNRFMKLMYSLPAFSQTVAPIAVVIKGWAKHWPG